MREAFGSQVGKVLRAIKNGFDFGDVIFILAVGAIGYGIAKIYEPLAWTVVGSIFIIVTVKKPGGDR